MKDIKKLMITLVALLAVTTGAWAQGPWTSGECTVTLNNGTLTVSGNGAMDEYADPSDRPWDGNKGAITSVVVESGVTSVGMCAFVEFSNMTSVTLPEGLTSIGDIAFYGCSSLQSITIPSTVTSIGGMAFGNCSAMTSVTLSEGLKTIGDMAFGSCSSLTSVTLPEGLTTIKSMAFYSCSSLTSITIPSTVTSIDDYAFMFSSAISDVNLYANPDNLTWGDTNNDFMSGKATQCHVLAEHLSTYQNKFGSANVTFVGDLQPLASGPEVAWNKAKNSGTFTMPGGNVTLEPEYYPQAALTAAPTAINDVPATTDGAIVEAGTVKNIGETTTAQGTVMYYVSPSPLDDAALLALAADQWTADVPTAADLAQGQAYVYYYVRGNDGDNDEEIFSDGDILAANALTVTIAAEPTYAVTFAEGVNPEPPAEPEWSASPAADVKKGQTVTVTYSGERKVMGVKAEKKAKGNIVDLSTYLGGSYEVTEDVTFTGTTNNEISILYKGEGYEVTLDNVNAPKCFIAAQDDNYNINVKLKGTSRLMGIYTQNVNVTIGEAEAGGTVILVDESPLGGNATTVTINGGTVKAKATASSTVYSMLEVNGGAVYLEAAEDSKAVSISASGSVTLYGWNGSAWETYTDHRYLSTDNSKAPSEWTW